eukprot:scaffold24520_cov101-Isochrysis_galbana.AAC.2
MEGPHLRQMGFAHLPELLGAPQRAGLELGDRVRQRGGEHPRLHLVAQLMPQHPEHVEIAISLVFGRGAAGCDAALHPGLNGLSTAQKGGEQRRRVRDSRGHVRGRVPKPEPAPVASGAAATSVHEQRAPMAPACSAVLPTPCCSIRQRPAEPFAGVGGAGAAAARLPAEADLTNPVG